MSGRIKNAPIAPTSSIASDKGAKKIIEQYPADTAAVPFEKVSIDIDTVSNYEALLNRL